MRCGTCATASRRRTRGEGNHACAAGEKRIAFGTRTGWTGTAKGTVPGRRSGVVRVSPTAALAVSQQEVLFAIVLLAETLYARSNADSDDPARPSLPATLVSCAGLLGSVALIYPANENFAPIGFGVGFLSTVLVVYSSIQRFKKTKPNPSEWPGPRAWPISVLIVSVLVLFILLQGLTNA